MSGQPDIAAAVASIEEARLEPIVRKAADEFYGEVLGAVQDYLRDNAAYNIGAHIAVLQRQQQDDRAEIARQAGVIGKLVEALETVEVLCTNHSGRAENMTTFEFMCLIHGLVQPVVIAAKGEVA